MSLLTNTAVDMFENLYPGLDINEFIGDAMLNANIRVENLDYDKTANMQENLINAFELTYSMANKEQKELSKQSAILTNEYDTRKKDIYSGKVVTVGDDSTHDADGKSLLKNNDTREAFLKYSFHLNFKDEIEEKTKLTEKVAFWESRKKILHHQKETLDSWLRSASLRNK